MTYQPNIPTASNLISVSQGDIQGNFQAIKTAFDINHITFNSSGEGKHKFIDMPNQTSNPTGAANQITLYSRYTTLPSSGNLELYYRPQTGTPIQLTAGTPTASSVGTSFLPGGIKINWGAVAAATPGANITFNSAFTTVFGVVCTMIKSTFNDNVIVQDGQLTTTRFRVLTTSGGAVPIFYYAVGL